MADSGNETIVYYNAAGLFVGDSWSYSDGSSGSETMFNNGLTNIPGSDEYSVPTTYSATTQNPDGSYQVVTIDSNDQVITTTYGADGSQTGSTTRQGPGQNFDVDPTYQTTTGDPATEQLTTTYDAITNEVVSDDWQYNAGNGFITGSDVFNTSGAESGKVTFVDGSHDTYTIYDSLGSGIFNHVRSSAESGSLSLNDLGGASTDSTLNQFDDKGTLTGSQWQMADGAKGSYTFANTGAGSGTMTHANGLQSTISLDGSGGITVNNLGSGGGVVSSDWWNSDGTHGVTTFDTGGSITSKYTYKMNGDVVVDSYTSDGMQEDTLSGGEVVSADDSFFVKVVNADGTYSIDYSDFNGDSLIFNYSGSTLTGTDQVSLTRNPPDGFSGTLGDGTPYTSPYNDASAVTTDADGTQRTIYFDNTGKEIGDDWTATDGSYGFDSSNPDGSTEGRHVNADGTYYEYQDDGAGNTSTQIYDADGSITQDQWTEADGSHGVDAYHADGSWQSDTYAADGSYNVYVEDAAGDYSYTYYDTKGVKTSDEWVNANGYYGDDTFNADGSSSGEAFNAEGYLLDTYTDDGAGDKTVNYYDGTGNGPLDLVQDSWTHADGSSGTDIRGSLAFYEGYSELGNSRNADGSTSSYTRSLSGYTSTSYFSAGGTLTGTSWSAADGTHGATTYNLDGTSATQSYNTDGTYNATVNDGKGDLVTTLYSAAGVALSDTWSKSDGSTGTDTFNADGSHSGTTSNPDGTRTTFVVTAAGVTTTQDYAANGTFSGSQVSSVNAAGSLVAANYDATGAFVSSAVTIATSTDTTTTTYAGANGTGTKLSDAWSTTSGTSGSDIYDASGNTIESTVNDGLGASTITLSGTANESVTGNTLTDTIVANSGNDTLVAGSGTDTLNAGSGTDVLVGGAGSSTMNSGNPTGAGTGSATFVLTHASAPVTINAGPKDTVDLGGLGVTGVGFVNGQWKIYGDVWDSVNDGYMPLAVINGTPGFLSLDGTTSMSFATAMADLGPNTQIFQEYINGTSDFYENAFSSVTMLPLVSRLELSGSNLVATANDGNAQVNASGSQDTLVGGAGADALVWTEQGSNPDAVEVGGSGLTNFVIDNNYGLAGHITIENSTAQETLSVENWNWGPGQIVEGISGTTLLANGSIDVSLSGIANVDVIIGTSGTYLGTIDGPAMPNGWPAGWDDTSLDALMQQNLAQQATSATSTTLAWNTVIETLTGSANITATGNTLDDIIYANSGNDTLIAGIASDTLVAGTGSDSMVGGAGIDLMQAGTGSDTMVAGTGADTFTPSTGNLTIVGAKSTDTLNFGNTPIADVTATSATTGGVTTVTLTSSLGGKVSIVGGTLGEVAFGSNGALSLAQLLGTAQTVFSSTGGTLAAGISSLTLTGSANLSATGNALNDLITANNGNDVLTAGSGIDTLVGGSGNDTLVSGTAIAVLVGGSGANTFVVNNAGDIISEPVNSKNNVEMTSVSATLAANVQALTGTGSASLLLTGNGLANVITANSGYDTLVGGSGTTTLVGGSSSDTMEGGSGATVMIDNSGSGSMIAGTGLTTMIGGSGSETEFYVNNAADVIIAAAYNYNEEVTSVSMTIAANIADLSASGTAAVVLTGGALDNERLYANTGNDTLVAGSGIVQFVGNTGDDVFIANNSGDTVYEASSTNPGNDTEETTVSIVLGDEVRNLVGLGSAALTLTGNGTNDDVITANSGADTLVAGSGNDTLVAGSGADVLIGGAGNDVFVINSAQDVIQEAANTGSNTEQTSISTVLAANVQNLVGVGSGDLLLTGNSVGGSVVANAGNDTLVAGGAATTLVGGTGSDLLIGNAAQGSSAATQFDLGAVGGAATIQGGGANDSLVLAGVLPQMITATSAVGTVNGVSGQTIVTLQVNGGRTITLDAPAFSSVTFADGSTTTIANLIAQSALTTSSATSATLASGMNRLILTGSGNLVGTGNNIADSLLANSGNDTLIAGSGVATMYGGAGNDVFVVNNAADVIVEGANTGQNVEQTSVSTTLATNVEQLVGTGSAALVLTGASTAGVVMANSGADTLVAGSGVTTLVGGAAGDTFEVNSVDDVVVGAAGTQNVELATASVTAGANVQALTDVGQSSITLTGNSLNDLITGGTSYDWLVAGSGNDTLVAGSGGAEMDGGTGNDTFVLGSPDDDIEAVANAGINTEMTAFSTTLAENVQNLVATGSDNLTLYGNDGNDVITGNSGADTIFAGSGNDTIISGTGDDYILGGSGNDTFVLTADASSNDYIEEDYVGGNNVEYTAIETQLAQNVQTLIATGSAALYLWGSGQDNDTVMANSGNDTLEANGGVTTLVAGAGSDVLFGNAIQSTGAVTTYDYSLGDGATSVWYTQSNDVLQFGTGITASSITATSQQATINGVAGSIVTLKVTGGTQVVLYAPAFTRVNFADGSTTTLAALLAAPKTLSSAVSATLPSGYTRLVLTGSANITGTGNNLADNLIANSGNDTLVAGSGLATLVGGTGNDTFVVNNVGDVISESPNSGNNTEQTSVSVTLAANVQNLTGTGSAALTLTGNNLNNVITANSGADKLVAGSGLDTLVSGTGIDTLVGGAGNDIFVVNNASDVITEVVNSGNNTEMASVSVTLAANVQNLTGTGTAGLTLTGNTLNDVVTANSGADKLVAGSGLDTLVSGTGIDTLVGGTGNDVFVVNNASDLITKSSNTGSNTEQASVSVTLAANVQNLTGIGAAAITLTGNTLANVITANSGNDTLVAGSGVATLVGGAGNDVFVVNNASDVIRESANTGNNTEQTSVSTTLATNVQNLTGTGSAALTLTGNSLNDLITANTGADRLVAGSGQDTLVSGTGIDTLVGGTGNDVFVINNASDVITEAANSGNNTEQASVSVTLAANVQNLTGIGSGALTLTGNTLNNVITANSGADKLVAGSGLDTLVSGTGVDTLVGGTANNVFVVNNASDVITKSANTGSNTEQTSVSVTLAANVQNLTGIGSAAIKLTGNTLNDVITANSGNDTLVAGSGTDTLLGGDGNYSASVGAESDTVTLGNGNDTLVSAEGSANAETFQLGNGGDQVTLGSGTDHVTLGNGVDTVAAKAGTDTLTLGTGQYTLANTGAVENVVLTAGMENQLWFAQVGNNLQINVLGSSEQITVDNWFTTGTKLNQLTSSDGHTINATGIGQLVQAMASFGIPPAGQTSYTTQEQTTLAPVMAANWH
jgi:Ca2+-binding RTX toxin-like protein